MLLAARLMYAQLPMQPSFVMNVSLAVMLHAMACAETHPLHFADSGNGGASEG